MQLRSAATFLFVASIVWTAIILFTKVYDFFLIGTHVFGMESTIHFLISLLAGVTFLLLGNSYKSRQYNLASRKLIGTFTATQGGFWLTFNSYNCVKEIVNGNFRMDDVMYCLWQTVLLLLPVAVLLVGIAIAGAKREKIRSAMVWMMIASLFWAVMILVQLCYRLYFEGLSGSPEMMLFDFFQLIKVLFPLSMFYWAMAVRKRAGENTTPISESSVLDEL